MTAIKSPLLMQREEHDETLLAKKVSVVSSATVFAVVNTAAGGAGVTTVYQGPGGQASNPWDVTFSSGATITPALAWTDPKTFIGLVTVNIGSQNAVEIKDTTSDLRVAVQAGATINYLGIGFEPLSVYQNTSLVSGFNFYGFTVPSNNPTTANFKVLRETIDTGEVLFGDGAPTFTHQWSSASLASISFS